METTEKIQAILNDSMKGEVDMEKYIHDICYLLLSDETLSTKKENGIVCRVFIGFRGL